MKIDILFILISYFTEGGICYMTLTEKEYPKKLAFMYLEEMRNGFESELESQYGER